MWVCVLSESGLLVCTSGNQVILHGFGHILVKKRQWLEPFSEGLVESN